MASHSHHIPSFLTPDDVDVKLNGSNYKEWLTTIRVILLGLEMFGHIDSTSISPLESSITSSGGSSSTTSALSARHSWHTDDHRATTLICQSCEINIRMENSHLGTTHESGSICSHV